MERLYTVYIHFSQARREGEGGGVFPAPRRLGAPPSLKISENGVPGSFFLTYNICIKSIFGRGAPPRTLLGELTTLPEPLVGW